MRCFGSCAGTRTLPSSGFVPGPLRGTAAPVAAASVAATRLAPDGFADEIGDAAKKRDDASYDFAKEVDWNNGILLPPPGKFQPLQALKAIHKMMLCLHVTWSFNLQQVLAGDRRIAGSRHIRGEQLRIEMGGAVDPKLLTAAEAHRKGAWSMYTHAFLQTISIVQAAAPVLLQIVTLSLRPLTRYLVPTAWGPERIGTL